MNTISKFLALALFAASAATMSYAAPSSAQAERVPYPQPDNQCCTPATRVIATGQPGWTVTNVNGNTFHQAVTLQGPLPGVWTTLPGSSWIGPQQGAGQTAAMGTYVYEYHFCLCDVPAGVKSFPASLSLHIYADDEVKVTLNNSPVLAQKLGGWAFTSSSPPAPRGLQSPPGGTPLNVSGAYFQRCDNVLRFQVVNGLQSPTGLDVYGTLSAYFRQQAPGTKCCAGGPPPYDR